MKSFRLVLVVTALFVGMVACGGSPDDGSYGDGTYGDSSSSGSSGGQCTGVAHSCSSQSVCQNGCYYDWNAGQCEGYPYPCSEIGNGQTCIDAGCHWQE